MTAEVSGNGSGETRSTCRPAGYGSVTPIVYLKNANDAIDFYERVFGAREFRRVPGPAGTVGHAEIRFGDTTVVFVDHLPGSGRVGASGCSPHVEFAVYCDDVDALFERALEAGASVAMPLTNVFWGDRYCKILDPFGLIWALATRREHLSPEQVVARASGAIVPAAGAVNP
jgi:PhnB protein